MRRVTIVRGHVRFSAEFLYEMAVLGKGPEAARAELRAMARTTDTESQALLAVCEAPVILTTTPEEKHERFYALVREVGEALRASMQRPMAPDDAESALDAYVKGFASGMHLEDGVYIGLSESFYQCGKLVAGMVALVYHGDQGSRPDFEEIRRAFRRGVCARFA